MKFLKKLLALLFLLALAGFVFFRLTAKSASADWYDEGWGYRASLTFTNSGSAVTNQYVTFALATNSTYSNLQSSCNDARFTDANGVILQYYQTNSCQAASTTYHVLMPNIPVGGNLVYFYFGNPNAVKGGNSSDFTQASFAQGTVTQGSVATGPGPIAWWQFNEGYGTTTTDSTANKLVGTLSGTTKPTWQTEDQCLTGKCLSYDGSTSHVVITGGSIGNTMNFSSGDSISLEAWINPNVLPSSGNSQTIVTKGCSDGIQDCTFALQISNDSGSYDIEMCYASSGGSVVDECWHSTNRSVITANTWQHIAFVETYGTASSAIAYYNGLPLLGTWSAGSGNLGPKNTAKDLWIGADEATGASPIDQFNGKIDDVKIYHYARSAAQIKSDYTARGTSKGSSALGTTDQNLSALNNGLLGYWKMDDTSWTPLVQNNYATPQSSTGHSTPLTVTYTSAQVAGDLNVVAIGWNTSSGSITSVVDSTGNSYSVATALSTGTSMTQVIYYAKNIGNAAAGTNTVTITLSADESFPDVRISEFRGIDTSSPLDGSGHSGSGNSASADSGSFSTTYASDLIFGAGMTAGGFTNHGSGFTTIDITSPNSDIHEYKTVATTGSYNAAATLGSNQWLMQVAAFKSPGPVSDSTGNGNGGTANGSVTASASKFGTAPKFDGSSKYINMPNTISGVQTVAFWAKPASTTDNFTNLITGTAYITSSSGTITGTGFTSPNVYINGVLNGTLVANTWNHVVVTSTAGINATAFEIGRANGSYAANNSQIDDVRVYNRALSSSEVSQLYSWAPGPVGYWKMDENTGQSANDVTGNGATATLGGNATWGAGKFGSALNLNGSTAYAATAANQSQLVQAANFTIEAWANASIPTFTSETIINKSNDCCGGNYQMNFNFQGKFMFSAHKVGSLSCTSNYIPPVGSWHHYVVTYDNPSDTVFLYVDGAISTQCAGLGGPPSTDTNSVLIGAACNSVNDNCTTKTGFFQGEIDEVRIFNYSRTSKQVVADMNGGHPAGGSPVGSQYLYWKLDEQQGSTANDSGYGNTAGTVSGPTWKLPVNCKINGCLSFANNTDNVTGGNITALNGIASMSASFWINPSSLTASKAIMSESNTNQEGFRIETYSVSSELKVSIATGVSDKSTYYVTQGLGLTANTWQHIVMIYDSSQPNTSRVKVYRNGVLAGGGVTGTIPGNLTASTAQFRIGQSQEADLNSLAMSLDEVKLYLYPLTQTDINIDYNRNSVLAFSTTDYGQNTTDGAGNPPIAWWKFDENTGTTANDTSGNNNTGTITGTNAATNWRTGRSGGALNINGSDTTMTTGQSIFNPTTAFTLTAWIYPRTCGGSSEGRILSKPNLVLDICGGSNQLILLNGDNATSATTTSTAITMNQWQHIAVVYNGSGTVTFYVNGANVTSDSTITMTTNSSNVTLSSASQDFDGLLDDFKIYTYARTQAQIAWDYNRGAPVGWWQFDECQGNLANDSTGNGNTGTLTTDRTVGTCQTSSTMWGDGATGKFNSALGLDDTGDYVNVPNNTATGITGNITISAWIKRGASANYGGLAAKTDGSTTWDYDFYISGQGHGANGNSDRLGFSADTFGSDSYSNTSLTDTTNWHQVALTRNGSLMTFYIDGVAVPTVQGGANSIAFNNHSNPLRIGTDGPSYASYSYFNGQIDDVRIYNYALSSTQIQQLYTGGAQVRFGPASGAP